MGLERLHGEFRRRVKTQKLAAERGRGTGSAFQPRSQRPDQVAQDRRLAEDRRRDKPAHWGSGMTSIGAALTVVLALALLASPLAAEAQQAAKVARIGYLATAPAEAASPHLREAFRQGLRDLGYVEGRNLVIEYRDAEGRSSGSPLSRPNWLRSRLMSS